MPIPGSKLNGINLTTDKLGLVQESDGTDDFYPSLATFCPIVKTEGTDGQELHTFPPVTSGPYYNIPCRKAPQILVRPQNQEHDSATFDKAIKNYQLNLCRWVDGISEEWQVIVVTGGESVLFEIKGIENSGGNKVTRLTVASMRPFNA